MGRGFGLSLQFSSEILTCRQLSKGSVTWIGSFNSPLRSSWILALWGSCAISFQSFNSPLRSSHMSSTIPWIRTLVALQFSFEILQPNTHEYNTPWLIWPLQFSFEILFTVSVPNTDTLAKPSILLWDPLGFTCTCWLLGLTIFLLQFSFEIFRFFWLYLGF